MDQSKVILGLSHTYALAQLGSILFMNFNREYLRILDVVWLVLYNIFISHKNT
jgi:hypothetical protein